LLVVDIVVPSGWPGIRASFEAVRLLSRYLSTVNLNIRLHSGLACRMLRYDICCETLECERKNHIDVHKAVINACLAYEICTS